MLGFARKQLEGTSSWEKIVRVIRILDERQIINQFEELRKSILEGMCAHSGWLDNYRSRSGVCHPQIFEFSAEACTKID